MKRKLAYAGIGLLVLGIIAGGVIGWHVYNTFYRPNLDLPHTGVAFYIGSNATANDVLDSLAAHDYLRSKSAFRDAAERMNYRGNNVKGGKYTLANGAGNKALLEKLRLGRGAEQVRVTFSQVRTPAELAAIVGHQIEADSLEIISLFSDTSLIDSLGFTPENFPALFLSDTYFFGWNTGAMQFVKRMKEEYNKFWNPGRMQKARAHNMSPKQAIILASIVQAEQKTHPGERAKIAGLYLNRLRRNIPLQSDPTVIYALGDFSITRVLTRQLDVDDPYNTYKYAGLPPGPILFPHKQSIRAVLNPEDHGYLYMCARPDFSGYHNFAKTLAQHNRNAAAFRRALNKKRIYR